MPSLLKIPQEWKDKMEDPAFCSSRQEELDNRLAADLGEQISKGTFTPYLYKYRGIDHALDMIENQRVKFSLVGEFGDPFDGRYIAKNLTPEIAMSRLKPYMQHVDGITTDDYQRIEAEIVKEETYYAILDYMLQEQSGVFCSTVVSNNILMWAYYGQSHEGVCMEFDIREDLKLFACSRHVNYQKQIPLIDFFSTPDNYEAFWDSILNKEPHWRYEVEMRTIKRYFHGFRHFAPLALNAVIFGVKTSSKDKQRIKDALRRNGLSHVMLRQADVDDRQYRINIRRL
jgi:hypothetical protein